MNWLIELILTFDFLIPMHQVAGCYFKIFISYFQSSQFTQVHRKSVKKGFEFTLMVVGESGLGKSTLINSLFLTDLYPGMYASVIFYCSIVKMKLLWIHYTDRLVPNAAEKIKKTVQLDASTVEIEERGVKLRLTGKTNKTCYSDILP
jgi:septin family protein